MSQRLSKGGRISRQQPLSFTFNGRPYRGFTGDTLASALLANGISLVGRSWKYHRPRGLLSAGVEEPNGLVQLFEGAGTVPNARMTEVELIEGLVARSIHAYPSPEFDLRAPQSWLSRLMPAGFYYKTFMASQKAWHFFERHIRAASGLGSAPRDADPDRYQKRYAHCDLLVVGGGVAGLSAALAAAQSGARVIVCDEQNEMGGWLLSSATTYAQSWLETTLKTLAAMPEVQLLPRTTAYGYFDDNLLTLVERRADHLPPHLAPPFRECLWRVRARQVVLATGSHERPLVFANNDLPGIMLAGAVTTYIRRYAVLPLPAGGQAAVFTNNDMGLEAALALHQQGVAVTVIDARPATPNRTDSLIWQLEAAGVKVMNGYAVIEARGRRRIRHILVHSLDDPNSPIHTLNCDLLAVSGGFSPVLHLHAQSGNKPVWSDSDCAFLPGPATQAQHFAGACNGCHNLVEAAQQGAEAGAAAVRAAGFTPATVPPLPVSDSTKGSITPLWLVPHPNTTSRAPKQFVDFQNDVTAADIYLAVREGFNSIELIKRYTAMGFGADQGKTGNINGMAIAAQALQQPIAQVGTTTFRPNYTPVTFGAIAGLELGEAFDPVRITAMHPWHIAHGALFEDVGQWKRPWYYPQPGEDMHAAVAREVLATRKSVGTLDASTLGKIDIQGPDAALFLNWLYINAWLKLEPGKCRYGFMLDENGMVFDDGVTVRLDTNHFLMHTTTGGAARVLAWMEYWLQTEWPHFKVYLTTVTDHWSTTAVVGPKSRAVLKKLCRDVDFDDVAFPFMSYRVGTVAGVKARIMRISFSGERSYEINVPSAQGLKVWEAVHEAGAEFGITPYGTETMHVLRAEKGFVIVGQDTDGSVSPLDLGMGGMVAKTKDFLGKRSLSRSDTARSDRKQFVGLLTSDPLAVLPEGAQVLAQNSSNLTATPIPMAGHVSSSYMSPTLGRSIALALVKGGSARLGEKVLVATKEGKVIPATISSPVFYDPKAERQNAE